jgi:hypothetical protein
MGSAAPFAGKPAMKLEQPLFKFRLGSLGDS